ncbi:LAMI_0E07976g1_1 [Lachancea mirantina]|uniref:Tyrosine--tRNA ligase n=1 Tax=Lachancea mirantina TaxID=1230905 RepID=A0A1G4JMQ0_9SACH|nr:LAMI_0E07976g1_1 [Lachancea mirantina]
MQFQLIRRLGQRQFVTKNVVNVLRDRGILSQVSQPEPALLSRLNAGEKIKLYCGADPTAKSLHLGNLLPLMILLNFYVRGHDVVALVGGATGRLGDPSGRKTERNFVAEETRLDNVSRIQAQLSRFFANGLDYYRSKNADAIPGELTLANNLGWWKDVKMLDFLADYGRFIKIQSMLSRDSVSARLGSQQGLGFNEFTYQVLQAYDFYHLYKNHGVTLQVGGSDQWGNITAGIDFINRVTDPNCLQHAGPFGITTNLLTTSTGEKFGKSAGNAVFIDPTINSSFSVYQFFLNTTDSDVEKLLKIFTFLSLQEIGALLAQHFESPHKRVAQRTLAKEAVNLIHGMGTGSAAEHVSEILFSDSSTLPQGRELKTMCERAGVLQNCSRNDSLIDVLMKVADITRSEARRRLQQNSIYLGPNRKNITTDLDDLSSYLIDDSILIVRFGKQKCFVLEMT